MTVDFILISILIALIQLSDSYLRYLAFSKKISKIQCKKLWSNFFICAIILFFIYLGIFNKCGTGAIFYKMILILSWIPFVTIQIKIIPLSKLQHFFIIGMYAIWNLFIHSITAMIDTIFFATEQPIFIFTCHSTIYLIITLILLPVERKCFINLLPKENFFDNQPYGKYIVALPFIITSSVLILWIDGELFHSWQERFSRLYLPVTFFLFYRYFLTANKQILENRKNVRYNQHLKNQLSALEQYNLLMQKNQQQMAILRHDMRHNYRLIYMMLQDGKIDKVLEHIKIQENLLDLTAIQFFCNKPLINSALSIYLQFAEKFGIKIKYKINLPENLNADENDIAILISNLLENAINASKLQPTSRREISIIIEHIENQCALEITNLFDGEIIFENNLPKTFEDGHGIGMLSLKNFLEKYDAQSDISHENGKFKIIIYWENI